MGDFFTSWSPRNSNNLAEGPWDQWVDLALMILNDPMTDIVRPDLFRAVAEDERLRPIGNMYTDATPVPESYLNNRWPT